MPRPLQANKLLSSRMMVIFLFVLALAMTVFPRPSRTAAAAAAYSLTGKRALVTGASGGIGKGIALALGRQGCHVLVHYNTRIDGAKQTLKELGDLNDTGGGAAGIVQCDFREPHSIRRMVQDDIRHVWPDGFDILVNNAGIVTKLALEDDDASENILAAWHECLAVNLHAPRLLSQLALEVMKKRSSGGGGGVILNVSSIHSEKSNEFVGPYAVSKAALDALTRSMAIEWACYNIRVNAIAPGVVPVERTKEYFDVKENSSVWQEKIPLGQLGTVEQVAQAALPLLTNDWVTGAVWQVDGGMMARSNMPLRPRPEKPSSNGQDE